MGSILGYLRNVNFEDVCHLYDTKVDTTFFKGGLRLYEVYRMEKSFADMNEKFWFLSFSN